MSHIPFIPKHMTVDQFQEWQFLFELEFGESDIELEERRFVDYNDIDNPEETVIGRYGSDHAFVIVYGNDDYLELFMELFS